MTQPSDDFNGVDEPVANEQTTSDPSGDFVDVASLAWERFLAQMGATVSDARNQMRVFLESEREAIDAAVAAGDTNSLESLNARLKGKIGQMALDTITSNRRYVMPVIDLVLNILIKAL